MDVTNQVDELTMLGRIGVERITFSEDNFSLACLSIAVSCCTCVNSPSNLRCFLSNSVFLKRLTKARQMAPNDPRGSP